MLYFNVMWMSVLCVMCLFLMVPWAGLSSVIVTIPSHIHFLSVLFVLSC